MRYVKLTKKQAQKVSSKYKGYTSGKRNKETGIRPTIIFCSSLDFVSVFGHDIKREFITI